MRRLASMAAAICTSLALAWAPGAPAHAATHNPIIFVHGYSGSASNWDTMVGRFAADGWSSNELFEWQYDWSQSNATTAQQLSTYVDTVLAQTGASQVDLVTHSMGGLSSRYYLRNLASAGKVDDWVSLGGPNHGTSSANWCFDTSCGEMRAGSSFLNALNSGDETPGAFTYGTFWSSCDGVILPADSTVLQGATNSKLGCVGHLALLTDATTYAKVRDFVR